jgi:hypothetical protein
MNSLYLNVHIVELLFWKNLPFVFFIKRLTTKIEKLNDTGWAGALTV